MRQGTNWLSEYRTIARPFLWELGGENASAYQTIRFLNGKETFDTQEVQLEKGLSKRFSNSF
jgi:hypothetical protein